MRLRTMATKHKNRDGDLDLGAFTAAGLCRRVPWPFRNQPLVRHGTQADALPTGRELRRLRHEVL
jgi:hypothetical protein